jgi:hypothetical protein
MGDGREKGLARRWGCDRAGGRPIETYTVQMARAPHVIGLMNVQYAIQGGWAPPADRPFSITNRNTVTRLLPESVNDHDKPSAVEVGKRLAEFGFTLVATRGTSAALNAARLRVWSLQEIHGKIAATPAVH